LEKGRKKFITGAYYVSGPPVDPVRKLGTL